MVPGQEANSDKIGIFFFDFLHNNCVDCTHLNRLDEAILMNTYNIQFHDKIRKFTKRFVFLIYLTNFLGTQKRARICHGERAIGVRAIEVRLYL